MGWNFDDNDSNKNNKKDNKITKILLICIAIFSIFIISIILLLIYIDNNTFKLIINGKETTKYSEDLIVEEDNNIYISLKDFATLAGYTYHSGEYKEYSKDETKAYVESKKETASFYLNSNKVFKLEPDKTNEDYEVFTVKNNIKKINDKIYAPLDAIQIAFNASVIYNTNNMTIKTLESLVTDWKNDANKKGYELSESFENQKAILYGYLVVKNSEKGLYGILDTKYNEIISPRYNEIKFLENAKEFLVTTNQNKVGIVDSQGKNKINQIYDSIKLIDEKNQIYLISQEQKYGVISKDGQYIIHPEYDKIGIDSSIYKNVESQYILLENFIPVCKNDKWGAFDIKGTMILSPSYNGFGCETTSQTGVIPIVEIPEVKGIVLKSGELYGIISNEAKELIPIALKDVYGIINAGKTQYYMTYKDNKMDVIEYINKNVKTEER